jgi:hypothetical protein
MLKFNIEQSKDDDDRCENCEKLIKNNDVLVTLFISPGFRNELIFHKNCIEQTVQKLNLELRKLDNKS